MPSFACSVRLSSSTSLTAAILASASPRNPSVRISSRSLPQMILLVACLSNAITASSGSNPQPLSVTRIYLIPPAFISAEITEAPASMAFSASSFTTEAGRSMTSPAAIWLAVRSSNIIILPIFHTSFPAACFIPIKPVSAAAAAFCPSVSRLFFPKQFIEHVFHRVFPVCLQRSRGNLLRLFRI